VPRIREKGAKRAKGKGGAAFMRLVNQERDSQATAKKERKRPSRRKKYHKGTMSLSTERGGEEGEKLDVLPADKKREKRGKERKVANQMQA